MSILFLATNAKTRLTPVIIKRVIILGQLTNPQALFALFKDLRFPLIIIKDHRILTASPVLAFANFAYNPLPS